MFYEVKGWGSIINLNDVMKVDFRLGSVTVEEDTTFLSGKKYLYTVRKPLVRIWFRNDTEFHSYSMNSDISTGKLASETSEDLSKEMNDLIEIDNNKLEKVYNELKAALNICNK